MRVSFNYQRKNIATGHYIEPNRWDGAKHRVKGSLPEAQEINSYIQQVRNKLFNLHSEMLKDGDVSLESLIEKFFGRDSKQMTLLELVKYHNDDFQKRIGID